MISMLQTLALVHYISRGIFTILLASYIHAELKISLWILMISVCGLVVCIFMILSGWVYIISLLLLK